MLFNSIQYLFVFLPLVFVGFHLLRLAGNGRVLNVFLALASLVFYGSWAPEYLLLIGFSVCANFLIGRAMPRSRNPRPLLLLGFAVNLGLLGYFKYAQFVLNNVMHVFGSAAPALDIILPIGISFFTFQQISFLVDAYRDRDMPYDFPDYLLFVTFFPQLIAGPIVYHREMMPQFRELPDRRTDWSAVNTGLLLIAIGLIKKVIVADKLGVWAADGYADVGALTVWGAWKTSLAYTFQLYYDFSGYMDIALGSAKLFGIDLPWNFNSPYLSMNIQEFWQRWHITLGRFLRNYVYFPLGGNRGGLVPTCVNLFLTFLIGGIWHGAGWTFVAWGAMHGAGMVIHRWYRQGSFRLPRPAAWLLTFLFVNAAWVYFRSPDFATANALLARMTDFGADARLAAGNALSGGLEWSGYLVAIVLFTVQDHFYRDSHRWAALCRPSPVCAAFYAATFATVALVLMSANLPSEFLYFQF
ncbi:MAG: MBOAT family protein [Desulfovibrionaceae bacterium]|nr:MBOAT family protein [Desulfovibrionaceae bacterium]